MSTYVVHLPKPLGLSVGGRGVWAYVLAIKPDGAAAEWNKGMLGSKGRGIRVGDQIIEVLDAEGQPINNSTLTFSQLMKYLAVTKTEELISLRLQRGAPGLDSPLSHVPIPGSSGSWKADRNPESAAHLQPVDFHSRTRQGLSIAPRLQSSYRSVQWRFHLGVCDPYCSPEEFLDIMQKHRDHYETLLTKHHILREGGESQDTEKSAESAREEKKEEDRSKAEAKATQQELREQYRLANQDLLEMLVKDIQRTFAEFPFFQDQANQRLLERILFIWALEQGNTPTMDGGLEFAYRQGMHELLAVIIMVLYKDLHRMRAQQNTSFEVVSGEEAEEQDLVLAGDRAALRALQEQAAAPLSEASGQNSEAADGAGGGAPNTEAEDTAEAGSDEMDAPMTPEEERYLLYWRSLHAYYNTHAPHKLNSIDSILRAYQGREDELWSDLARKYGVPPSTVMASKSLSPRTNGATSSSTEYDIDSVIDSQWLEHDAYTLFQYLMHSCLSYYTGAAEVPGLPENRQPPLYRKVQGIHFTLLKKYDRELWDHMQAAGVLPQLYLIRWLRVLFTREFTLQQSFLIWDHLLPSKGMDMADYICVAMLIYVRELILREDPSRCLMCVFHYPTLSDPEVRELLDLAVKLYTGEYQVPLGKRAKVALRQVKETVYNSWSSLSDSVRRGAAAIRASRSPPPQQPQTQQPTKNHRRQQGAPEESVAAATESVDVSVEESDLTGDDGEVVQEQDDGPEDGQKEDSLFRDGAEGPAESGGDDDGEEEEEEEEGLFARVDAVDVDDDL